jgi:hypothetical protein
MPYLSPKAQNENIVACNCVLSNKHGVMVNSAVSREVN